MLGIIVAFVFREVCSERRRTSLSLCSRDARGLLWRKAIKCKLQFGTYRKASRFQLVRPRSSSSAKNDCSWRVRNTEASVNAVSAVRQKITYIRRGRAFHRATEAGGTSKTGMYPENVRSSDIPKAAQTRVCTPKRPDCSWRACIQLPRTVHRSTEPCRGMYTHQVQEDNAVTTAQLRQRARHRATGWLREQDYVRFSSGQLALRGEIMQGSLEG